MIGEKIRRRRRSQARPSFQPFVQEVVRLEPETPGGWGAENSEVPAEPDHLLDTENIVRQCGSAQAEKGRNGEIRSRHLHAFVRAGDIAAGRREAAFPPTAATLPAWSNSAIMTKR